MSRDDEGPVGRLPSELTSFIGRRRELTEVKQLLEVSRLVTLTGIGGVGKTRLSLRVGAAVRRAFRDSVCFVELGDLTDSAMVAEIAAAALGILDHTNRPVRQLVEEHVATRQLLLILDNCEHLLDTVAEFAQVLLKASPELKILTTSREPLNIGGEAVLVVPPLTIPDADTADTGSPVGEAVALFAERARAHVPGFELTPENTGTVMRICQQLDGLPLPIELAAARIRTLSTTQILEHLTDRYRLLAGGRRGVPSRQQTLRGSVDWSRDLCSADEQRLWARLSVFAGGAEFDAVEYVCTDNSEDTDILDLLGSLVDKSIVIREGPDNAVRYRMLEILREYGRSDLLSSGEYADVRRRHRDFYSGLVARAADGWVSADRSNWAARLTREQANIREAMEFSYDTAGEGASGLKLASALYPYWLTCGHFTEGRRWLDRGLAADGVDSGVRARAAFLGCVLAGTQGDMVSAEALLDHANSISDELAPNTAVMHYACGYVALFRGEPECAIPHLKSAAAIFRADGDVFLEWGCLEGLGLAHINAANMRDAVDILNEALALTAIGENPELHPHPLWNLGIALWQLGEATRASIAVNRGLEISRHSDPLALAYCLQVSAWIAADTGHEERAAKLLAAAATVWHQLGNTIQIFPQMRRFQDQCESQLRAGLTAEQLAVASEQGAAMTREDAAAFALGEQRPKRRSPHTVNHELTKREREVAALVAKGLTNKAIAEALVVSQRTAQGHVENILMKLGFNSRTQIAAWAAQRQLTE